MVMTLMTFLAMMGVFDTSQTKEITQTFTGGLGENKEYKKSTKKGKMVLKKRKQRLWERAIQRNESQF